MAAEQSWTLHRPTRRRWRRVVVGAAVLWGTILATMVLFEGSLIYFPDRFPNGDWDVDAVAAGSGATVEDCFFDTEDGVRLHAWWCRPEATEDRVGATGGMVLLWFHGNAGNLAQRADQMLELSRTPAQVFIVDYRGYGRSAGRPSENGLYRDARAAWHYLTRERGVDPQRIVVLGKSLGGAVAVDLASSVSPAGLIVESSFTSIPAMAAHHYPFVPRWLVRTKMDSLAKIGRVGCPVMVIHSPDDEIVPFAHGRRLYDAVAGDRRLLEVPGAGHNELWLVAGNRYLRAIGDFLVHCRTTGGGR